MSTDFVRHQIAELRQEAMAALRANPAYAGYTRLFTYRCLPSVADSWRLTLFDPDPLEKNGVPFAELCLWQAAEDRKTLVKPVAGLPVLRLKTSEKLPPTLPIATLPLKSQEATRIMASLRAVAFHPILKKPVAFGCDGISHEFEFGCPFHGLKIHWWEKGPKEWRPYTEAVEKMALELKVRFPRFPGG